MSYSLLLRHCLCNSSPLSFLGVKSFFFSSYFSPVLHFFLLAFFSLIIILLFDIFIHFWHTFRASYHLISHYHISHFCVSFLTYFFSPISHLLALIHLDILSLLCLHSSLFTLNPFSVPLYLALLSLHSLRLHLVLSLLLYLLLHFSVFILYHSPSISLVITFSPSIAPLSCSFLFFFSLYSHLWIYTLEFSSENWNLFALAKTSFASSSSMYM